jgi:hypothetical protein
MDRPIPVICDCCRAEGLSAADPFAGFGALLDFDPVPRRTQRADGWDAEVQRAFIAALSLTGNVRSACRAVARSPFGVEQLRRAEGNEGFVAAFDEAMAMAGDERSRRLAEGLQAVAAEQAGWRRPEPPWSRAAGRRAAAPPAEPPEPDEAELARREKRTLAALGKFFDYYLQRLAMERDARLEGRILEADFYVRQITAAEIWIELLSEGESEAVTMLQKLRVGPRRRYPQELAETGLSRLLDEARRRKWEDYGEPRRPRLYLPEEIAEEDGHRLIKSPSLNCGPDLREREAAQHRAHEAAARAQIEWEEEARREAAAWRARLEAEDACPPQDKEGDHAQHGGGGPEAHAEPGPEAV